MQRTTSKLFVKWFYADCPVVRDTLINIIRWTSLATVNCDCLNSFRLPLRTRDGKRDLTETVFNFSWPVTSTWNSQSSRVCRLFISVRICSNYQWRLPWCKEWETNSVSSVLLLCINSSCSRDTNSQPCYSAGKRIRWGLATGMTMLRLLLIIWIFKAWWINYDLSLQSP